MKIQIQTTLEHGVLFLLDPYAKGKIPSDTGADLITFTDSCVAFQVNSYLDGDTNVVLTNESYTGNGARLFSGNIVAPNKLISLLDSRDFYYCILPVKDKNPSVTLWQYEEGDPEGIWVTIEQLDVF